LPPAAGPKRPLAAAVKLTGAIDFPDIFTAGQGRRLDKHFIIEHDWPQLSHPDDPDAEYKTAKTGLDYLRAVRW
jgi:hypothetical protein